ncbi:MAG TPA: ATP-binding protein [Streptosporangiaceae bacterium]|jgi:anti-sigma regulatory factor (Ser/Thr protein kinase)|nr:ATP-binding protein [Streptosporangiaceae bacterium]
MAGTSPPSRLQPQQRAATGTWLPRTHLELGALPGAVPCARLHTRHVVWECGLTDLTEAAELIVSELVTNAVQASAAAGLWLPGDDGPARLRCVWLWLASNERQLLVEVGDTSPRPPRPAEERSDVEGGRGLLLIEAVSLRWGHYSPGGSAGNAGGRGRAIRKIVWAVLGRP